MTATMLEAAAAAPNRAPDHEPGKRPETPDDPGAAIVPQRLARLAAFLIEYAVKDISSRGGSSSAMPGLPELRAILRPLAASAGGRPSVILEPQARAGELSTTQAAAVMGISTRRVRHHASSGRIIARKVAGRDWLIEADSARSYRRERTAA